jgi:Uma2 family endonuclease
VPEYWYVDLDADRIEVYRLVAGRYGTPVLLERGDRLSSAQIPHLSLDVDELLGQADD